MEERYERYHPDMEAIHHSFRTQPCFVCRMVEENVRNPENIIYEDERALEKHEDYPRATAAPWLPPRSTASR